MNQSRTSKFGQSEVVVFGAKVRKKPKQNGKMDLLVRPGNNFSVPVQSSRTQQRRRHRRRRRRRRRRLLITIIICSH